MSNGKCPLDATSNLHLAQGALTTHSFFFCELSDKISDMYI